MLAFVGGVNGNRGYTRVGILEPSRKAIMWKCEKQEISAPMPSFKEVSIAISPSKDVVIAYRLTYMKLCCQVGKITTAAFDDQCIEFYSEASDVNIRGFHPSVTINQQGHIILMYQSTTLRKIMLHTGIIQARGLSGGIKWKDDMVADHVDYGCYPVVTLADTGIFIEVHGTNFGTSLFYRAGRLE